MHASMFFFLYILYFFTATMYILYVNLNKIYKNAINFIKHIKTS
jgi:hypothetical protein